MSIFDNQAQQQRVFAPAGQVVVEGATVEQRLAFIRKVYGLLAISLALGIGAGAVTLSNPAFLQAVAQNMMLLFFAEIGVLLLSNFVNQQGTLALVLLNAFTVLTGITTAPIVFVYQDVALSAALTTVAIFLGLSVYTFVSKKDFSYLGSALMMVLIGMVVLSVVNIFLKSSMTQFLLSAAGVVVFSGFILFETSNIMRRYPTTMYIQATLGLYVAILNLFLSLLQVFGGGRRSN